MGKQIFYHWVDFETRESVGKTRVLKDAVQNAERISTDKKNPRSMLVIANFGDPGEAVIATLRA